MYIHCEGEIFMLDRDNSVFSVPQLRFLSRKRRNDHIFETLVDGVSHCYGFELRLSMCVTGDGDRQVPRWNDQSEIPHL